MSTEDAPRSEEVVARLRARQVTAIGKQIRALRTGRVTLQELSVSSGLSIGLLSRLENGIGNPSLASLHAIARALGVHVREFFEDSVQVGTVVRRDQRVTIRLPNARGELEMLVVDPSYDDTAGLLVLPPGALGDLWSRQSNGRQFNVVLDGSVEYHIEHEVHQLHRGDSLLFDSSRPHSRRNLSGTQPARVLIIAPSALLR